MRMFAALESRSMEDLPSKEVILGRSSTMNTIQRSGGKPANADIPVLLQSESGTGKEIQARFIHCQSRWGNGALVKVSCPAILGILFKNGLLRYGKGASTDIHGTKPIWRWPLCGHVDESMGNLAWLGLVF